MSCKAVYDPEVQQDDNRDDDIVLMTVTNMITKMMTVMILLTVPAEPGPDLRFGQLQP